MTAMATSPTPATFRFSTEGLREHWQGHRRVTRRMIEAFPEEALFTFSVGGMRPFAAMALEMISMAQAGIRGVALRDWTLQEQMAHHAGTAQPRTRVELLASWDETTALIDSLWPGIPASRFEEVDTAFGIYEGVIYGLLWYWIDNEIHHRGQGYVYLRALGIEPPAFYDRS
jgi:uncharacterized damage-inducible protein DinB